jgi:hypothetical protein
MTTRELENLTPYELQELYFAVVDRMRWLNVENRSRGRLDDQLALCDYFIDIVDSVSPSVLFKALDRFCSRVSMCKKGAAAMGNLRSQLKVFYGTMDNNAKGGLLP